MIPAEEDNPNSEPLLVVGISAAGPVSLPLTLLNRIASADLLAGGKRHLGYFPDFQGERLTIGANIEAVVKRLQTAVANDERAVILASGDPLFYGIGATLRDHFPADALEIIPAATSFQLAFSALAEPWHEAALVSAHGRPLDAVIDKLIGPEPKHNLDKNREPQTSSGNEPCFSQAPVLNVPKAAILTDNQHTPAVIAHFLLEAGLSPNSDCAICENLGGNEQNIIRGRLADVGRRSYSPLNVFIVWRFASEQTMSSTEYIPTVTMRIQGRRQAHLPGLSDDAFSTSAAQITKREVRLLALAELKLGSDEVMWDVGAGSGSVAIEAARSQPGAAVYAIERRAKMCDHIQENLRRFPAPNLQLTQGVAPDDIAEWPAPNAVFVGGSGGQLEEIIATIQNRLQDEGRLVINLATLENLQTVARLLPEAGITQLQINRGVPIMDMTRFEALNPVFMVTWQPRARS